MHLLGYTFGLLYRLLSISEHGVRMIPEAHPHARSWRGQSDYASLHEVACLAGGGGAGQDRFVVLCLHGRLSSLSCGVLRDQAVHEVRREYPLL